jgi:2,4-dienoyl-CoA reductase-like NADH-dependent reductase (Old Yellow Enzyme family)
VLDALFSPLRLGPVDLPNRIVSTAHQTTLVHEHLPTDDFVAYHEARARAGTGLIVLEASAVHPSGLLTPHTLAGFRGEIVPALRRVA